MTLNPWEIAIINGQISAYLHGTLDIDGLLTAASGLKIPAGQTYAVGTDRAYLNTEATTHAALDTGVHGSGAGVLATDTDIAAENLYSNVIDLIPFLGTSIQGTWVFAAYDAQYLNGFFYNSSVNVNDEYNWLNVLLQKGTYKISMIGFKGANRGIFTATYDGTTILTGDMYSGGNVANEIYTDTFVLAANTSGTVELKCTSKHASSSGYGVFMSLIRFERTA